MPVISCFGGLAVYTMDAFRRCYHPTGDCEHVLFHSQMTQDFCNPSQLVIYPH